MLNLFSMFLILADIVGLFRKKIRPRPRCFEIIPVFVRFMSCYLYTYLFFFNILMLCEIRITFSAK